MVPLLSGPPSVLVTVWETLSWLVQVTVSPMWAVWAAGAKAKPLMLMAVLALGLELELAATEGVGEVVLVVELLV